jgi:hypothetical protein
VAEVFGQGNGSSGTGTVRGDGGISVNWPGGGTGSSDLDRSPCDGAAEDGAVVARKPSLFPGGMGGSVPKTPGRGTAGLPEAAGAGGGGGGGAIAVCEGSVGADGPQPSAGLSGLPPVPKNFVPRGAPLHGFELLSFERADSFSFA